MNNNIFPFKVLAHDCGTYVHSPKLAESIWSRLRGNTNWYACDIEITSINAATLFVYGMEDSFHGGIGNCIKELEISDFTDAEQEILKGLILNKYTALATLEFQKRVDEENKSRILTIRKELFGV